MSTAVARRTPDRRRWRVGRRLVIPLAILALWVVVSEAHLVRSLILPSPEDVRTAFEGMAPLLPGAILTSVTITLSGFVIGVAVGVGLGLVMAYSRTVRDLLGTIFDLLRPVPIFALIPLFLLWFGIGRAPQIALIAMGCSVVLGVTTSEAIRNIPLIYVRAALTLGADHRAIYRTVIVPAIVPHLIGAIRVAAAGAWGLDVAAEFMGSQEGLGYLIILQQTYLRTAGIFVLVAIYAVLAVILDTAIARLESRITGWTERRSGSEIVGAIVGL